ncbi:CPBP family intramembrane glutamic endopeptidase [Bacillus cereus]|uniref:CAAX protease self-immunity family protein n=1 Tax=Bacillus cereus 03BB108 TaxID=451709 RepID=A0AAN0SRQ1_BACCE|nr:CPBP family intramembrane glutamic endopeptidase [Bacillus cereus]AJI09106.1 CAAX protease self-immunity family protein [Bacillus cereus 03BB108]EDX59570.1 caax amino protease family [Bacillus cereus 03BB108]
MESYSKYMLFSIKVSLTIMLAVIMIGLLRLTDNYLKWAFFEAAGLQTSMVFMLLIAVLIMFKSVRDYFSQHFVKIRKMRLVKVIGISIILGIGLQFLISFVANGINVFNPNLIKPGSNQYVSDGNLSTEGELVIAGLLGPFNEEVIYRLFMYVYFFSLLNACKNKFVAFNKFYDGSEEKERYFKILWLIMSNVIFTMIHGADITNFWIYFIPGIIYGALFMKYGFLAAWIGHSAFNVSSNSVGEIMVYLFGLYK